MFSGIIYHQSKILDRSEGIFTMENVFGEVLKEGESIAHNGACMTVLDSDSESYTFQAVEESLSRTNLGAKQAGDAFHVERSIRFDQRLDGHLLSGHIDTTGEVVDVEVFDDGSRKIWISYPEKDHLLVVEKGWIALDGVSLTIVDDEPAKFSVVIIPATQDMTHLGGVEIGDRINIEYDLGAKYFAKMYKTIGWGKQ